MIFLNNCSGQQDVLKANLYNVGPNDISPNIDITLYTCRINCITKDTRLCGKSDPPLFINLFTENEK